MIESPAAWTSSTLSQAPDWLQILQPDELADLRQIVETNEEEVGEIAASRVSLGAMDQRLQQIQASLEHGCGATWLRGLDLSDYTDQQARRLFWHVVRQIGTPVSQAATGERLFAVQDAGFAETDRRARGPNTRKRLSFHTDRCDVIAFLCVRQAVSGGENDIVSSVTLYNRILASRPDLCHVLMSSYHYQRHNVDQGNELPYCQQPIFSFHEGKFAANFLRVLIERAHTAADVPDMTPEQREALDYLEQTAEDRSLFYRFRLEPGDMLFLNNWVTFHRRTEFEDAVEPHRKRLLYRAWLSVPNSRGLDPRFAANYGATAAGAVRGGMKRFA